MLSARWAWRTLSRRSSTPKYIIRAVASTSSENTSVMRVTMLKRILGVGITFFPLYKGIRVRIE